MSSDVEELRDKIRKVEALLARPGTPGELQAAMQALQRLGAKLAEAASGSHAAEDETANFRTMIADPYLRSLFLWLCRKHGVEPYRSPRQRYSTIRYRTSESINLTMWREYIRFRPRLQADLEAVKMKFLREETGHVGA